MQVIKQCKCNTEFTKTQVDTHIKNANKAADISNYDICHIKTKNSKK